MLITGDSFIVDVLKLLSVFGYSNCLNLFSFSNIEETGRDVPMDFVITPQCSLYRQLL